MSGAFVWDRRNSYFKTFNGVEQPRNAEEDDIVVHFPSVLFQFPEDGDITPRYSSGERIGVRHGARVKAGRHGGIRRDDRWRDYYGNDWKRHRRQRWRRLAHGMILSSEVRA